MLRPTRLRCSVQRLQCSLRSSGASSEAPVLRECSGAPSGAPVLHPGTPKLRPRLRCSVRGLQCSVRGLQCSARPSAGCAGFRFPSGSSSAQSRAPVLRPRARVLRPTRLRCSIQWLQCSVLSSDAPSRGSSAPSGAPVLRECSGVPSGAPVPARYALPLLPRTPPRPDAGSPSPPRHASAHRISPCPAASRRAPRPTQRPPRPGLRRPGVTSAHERDKSPFVPPKGDLFQRRGARLRRAFAVHGRAGSRLSSPPKATCSHAASRGARARGKSPFVPPKGDLFLPPVARPTGRPP